MQDLIKLTGTSVRKGADPGKIRFKADWERFCTLLAALRRRSLESSCTGGRGPYNGMIFSTFI
jgi:hypothetical protein